MEELKKEFEIEAFELNYQKAKNLGNFEMISAELAAVHHFCKLANYSFIDINQKNKCYINNQITLIKEFTQTNEIDLFMEDLVGCDAEVKNFIFYSKEQGKINILGFISKNYVDKLPWKLHFGVKKECKKIMLDTLKSPFIFFDAKYKKSKETIAKDQPFTHLHYHSEYSIGDGYGKLKKVLKDLKLKGFKALALTDHATLAGTFYFNKACLENNIKPIFGIEVNVILNKGDKKYYHLVLLAKNKAGWLNLLKIQELSVKEYFYYRPKILLKEILKYNEGLIVTSACMSGLISKFIIEKQQNLAEHYLITFKQYFKEDFYLELMPNRIPEQKIINQKLIELAKKHQVKLIITTDAHYSNSDDSKIHQAVKAISWKKKYSEAGFSDDTFYLMDCEKLRELINKYHPYIIPNILIECLDTTQEIVDKCGFKLKFNTSNTLPELCDKPAQRLKALTYAGLETYTPYKLSDKKIKDRLDFELKRFIDKGYENYFLIVHDYVQWCKNNDIMVGPGRGSVGGSLVAYALNITETDPIKFNLLFDRFISEIRKDMPDIDLDFEDSRRKDLIKYLTEKYSASNVAKVITYSLWHAKGALRDVGRIFNIPVPEINKISNLVVTRSGGDARTDFCLLDTFTEFENARAFYEKYKEACDIAIKLEGCIRHRGLHAAGLVITKTNISEVVPVEKISDNICVAYEKKAIEEVGLIKFDILGLKTLSVIKNVLALVDKNIKLPITFNDEKVYEKVFAEGNCFGVFQFETIGLSKLCKQLKINSFKTLYDTNTLYRPGPLHSGETADYVLRHNKKKEWEYEHELLKPITAETYGLILYQEQVMQVMYDLGKFSWATAESARKIMTKSQGKDTFNKMRKEFVINSGKSHGLTPVEAGRIFDVVSTFGSYGFNKSHAVEYSIISYWCAWLKTYYPKEFFTALLTRETDSNQIANYVRDAKKFDLEVLTPDINLSKIGYYINDNKIIAGFDSIKGVGLRSAEKLIKYQPYNLKSFVKSKPSKTIWENLAKAGALDSFGITRKEWIERREEIMSGEAILSPNEYDDKTKALMQLEVLDLPSEKPAIDYFDNPFANNIVFEKIGDLEFDDWIKERWVKGVVTFINFKQEGLEGQWTMFDNVLERRYAHLNITDGTGNILIHLSPEQYTYYKHYLESGTGFPVIIKAHSIPNFNKLYCDGMIVLDKIDNSVPLVKYINNKRVGAIAKVQDHYKNTSVLAEIIQSVTYKVSKNKNPYARINFYGLEDSFLCFKLTSQIFVAGEIVAFRCDSPPFIEVVGRW